MGLEDGSLRLRQTAQMRVPSSRGAASVLRRGHDRWTHLHIYPLLFNTLHLLLEDLKLVHRF